MPHVVDKLSTVRDVGFYQVGRVHQGVRVPGALVQADADGCFLSLFEGLLEVFLLQRRRARQIHESGDLLREQGNANGDPHEHEHQDAAGDRSRNGPAANEHVIPERHQR